MEFRRINGLPPYVFAHIDALKLGARRAGRDVIDLGFGNPDIASPDVAVEKLAEAVQEPAEPPLLGEPRHPEAPPGGLVALPEAVRRRDRPRHRSGRDDRRQRGSLAPDVGAARSGRQRCSFRRRRTRSTSTPRCSPEQRCARSDSRIPADQKAVPPKRSSTT